MTVNKNINYICLLLFFICLQNIFADYIQKRDVNEIITEANSENNLENCGYWLKGSQAPWHVGIYKKEGENYVYFCGGSIISQNVIVTAAHCLTNEKKNLRPSELFVGAGKYYSAYNDNRDWTAQYKEIKKYILPNEYNKAQSNLKGDLGLIILKEPLTLPTFAVQPICVDWNNQFEKEHLSAGNTGSIQGWGYTDLKLSTPSEILMQLDVPFRTQADCLRTVPEKFQNYLTEDKFCAGYTNGSCVCNGDDGGGLVFPKTTGQQTKYYIRGVLSTYPQNNGACDMYQYGVYTKISYYRELIQKVVNENKIKSNTY